MATSVIKPNNAGIDLPISLPTTGWSSNQWTYSNSAITADCAIEVEFKDGTLNTNVPYIEYEKASGGGGIVFTVPSVPTVAIPVVAHVYFMQNGSFTTAVDTAITTTGGAESLGANVSSALIALNTNLGMSTYLASSTLNELKSSLLTIAGTIPVGGRIGIQFDVNSSYISDIGVPGIGTYQGFLERISTYAQGYFSANLADNNGNTLLITYSNGTWKFNSLTTASLGMATINSTYYKSGNIRYFTIGNVCFVHIEDLEVKTNISASSLTIFATGLPVPKYNAIFALHNLLNGGSPTSYNPSIRVIITSENSTGVIKEHYSLGGIVTGHTYEGFCAYIVDE